MPLRPLFMLVLVAICGAAAAREQAQTPPNQCVDTRQIRSTNAIDNQTIIFKMRNGEQWKNTLTHECPSLKFHNAFSYRLSGTRLCDIDVITVIQQPLQDLYGPTCFLGKFERYTPPPKESTKVKKVASAS